MYDLLVASMLFLLLHLGVSGTCLRGEIVRSVGEKVYIAGFSLCALVILVWLTRSYSLAYVSAANRFYVAPPDWYRALSLPVMGFAFFLGLPGLMMKNPTSVLQDGAPLCGVERITRHPFLWGAAIWALYHLLGAADVASAVVFATFLILSVGGTFSIDAKCRRRLGGAAWRQLATVSSNLPFLALVLGRNRVSPLVFLREYGLIRFLITLVIFCLVILFHSRLFGTLPVPAGWLPGWWPGL